MIALQQRQHPDLYIEAAEVAAKTTPSVLAKALNGFGQPDHPDVAVLDFGPETFGADMIGFMPKNGRRNRRQLTQFSANQSLTEYRS